jgi:hypothetical protein
MDKKDKRLPANQAKTPFLLYAADDEKIRVRVMIHAETIWLTQRQMADLFQTSADNIGLHLKNIYAEDELGESATTEDFSVVQQEGPRNVQRTLKHYNLDAIIAVGYPFSPIGRGKGRRYFINAALLAMRRIIACALTGLSFARHSRKKRKTYAALANSP